MDKRADFIVNHGQTEPSGTDATRAQAGILSKTSLGFADAGSPYAILDFPDHSNVGDSAIFLGELAWLKATIRRDPSYVCSMRSYTDDIDQQLPDGTIYLHGGGNFGDVWPRHQDFRESILQKHPNRKIVQLPQSMHFRSEKALDQCAAVIDKHADFTFLVRDEESFAVAKAKFNCEVTMCPDAAFALGKMEKTRAPMYPILCMLRGDNEGCMTPAHIQEITAFGPVEDWLTDTPDMKSKQDRLIEKTAMKVAIIRPRLQSSLCKIYEKWARERVDRGIAQLSAAEFVITDRLHVHIFCSLLGIPHVIFDNNYGKISRYINAWPKNDLGTVVRNMDEFRNAISHHSKD